MPHLFDPLEIGALRLANRIVIAPMCQYSAEADGGAGDWHLIHLGHLALSGAGLMILEATAVSPEGRITPGCGGLWNDAQEAAWKRIVDFGHTTFAKMGIQIGHAGRKASTKVMWEGIDQPLDSGNWPIIGPSPIPYLPHSQVPREMTRADMDEVKAQFVATTERAARAGFDVLEIHGAHGYLLHEFVSPISNQRTDEYGGSFENRIRLPLEIVDGIRAAIPATVPLFYRYVSGPNFALAALNSNFHVPQCLCHRSFGEHLPS